MQSYGGFQLVPTFFLFFASGCCDTHRFFVTYSGKVVIFVAKYLFIDVRKVKNCFPRIPIPEKVVSL